MLEGCENQTFVGHERQVCGFYQTPVSGEERDGDAFLHGGQECVLIGAHIVLDNLFIGDTVGFEQRHGGDTCPVLPRRAMEEGAHTLVRIPSQGCHHLVQLFPAVRVGYSLTIKVWKVWHHLLEFLGMLSQISDNGHWIGTRLMGDADSRVLKDGDLKVFYIFWQWVGKLGRLYWGAQVDDTTNSMLLQESGTLLFCEYAQFPTATEQTCWHTSLAVGYGNSAKLAEVQFSAKAPHGTIVANPERGDDFINYFIRVSQHNRLPSPSSPA